MWGAAVLRPYKERTRRQAMANGPLHCKERGRRQTGPTMEKRVAVDTVYIGGGTPSLLDPAHLERILDTIRVSFGQRPASEGGPYKSTCVDLMEVTLEADPETVEAEKAATWVRAGINRVSFGLQSFADKELIAAGRMHRRADIYRAVPILREAGIGNISFDLIGRVAAPDERELAAIFGGIGGAGAGARFGLLAGD